MSKKYSLTKKLLMLVLLAPNISNAEYNIIDSSKNDIINFAKEHLYKEVEDCNSLSQSFCQTVIGSAYYWNIGFKDKKETENDTIARIHLQKVLVDSITARELVGYILGKEYPKESYALILSAAYEGDTDAIYELGHTSRVDTDKDIIERIKWRKLLLNKAPELAKDECGYIGNFYLRLTTPDYPNALYWLKKAVIEEDDMSAQFDMAHLYAEGKGVDQDYVTAYMYYDLSGSAGSEEKAKLTKYMTPAQVQEGIYRSHQWQDEHHSYRPGYGAWNDTGGIEWNVH